MIFTFFLVDVVGISLRTRLVVCRQELKSAEQHLVQRWGKKLGKLDPVRESFSMIAEKKMRELWEHEIDIHAHSPGLPVILQLLYVSRVNAFNMITVKKIFYN